MCAGEYAETCCDDPTGRLQAKSETGPSRGNTVHDWDRYNKWSDSSPEFLKAWHEKMDRLAALRAETGCYEDSTSPLYEPPCSPTYRYKCCTRRNKDDKASYQ